MANVAQFAIGRREQNNPNLTEHQPNSVEYTYLASAINIALSMMETESGRQRLAYVALKFDTDELGSTTFNRNQAVARNWTDWYISQLRSQFPNVIVDETLTNIDCLGYHPRGIWNGNLQDFNFRLQGIHLNGSRVRDMVAAGQDNSTAGKSRFRTFQFAFATTLVHEAGAHILITWLGKGRPFTPPSMAAPGYRVAGIGEAGRFLESLLFGGTTEFYRDPRRDDSQTGVPHQIDNQGWAWKISSNFIDAICRYQFTFPFPRVGDRIDPRTMFSMGRNSVQPPQNIRDRSLMAQQQSVAAQLPRLRAYAVKLSDLRLVPNNPRQRLVAVA